MSAQCWCYTCAGRIVVRSTFIAHGRKDKPDEPLREDASIPLESMPEGKVEREVPPDQAEDSLSEEEDREFDELGLANATPEEDLIGRGKLSVAEVTLFLLDWMCTHKVT